LHTRNARENSNERCHGRVMVAEECRGESKTNVLHVSGNKAWEASRKFARAKHFKNSSEPRGQQNAKSLLKSTD
jgi:hypothetical protein